MIRWLIAASALIAIATATAAVQVWSRALVAPWVMGVVLEVQSQSPVSPEWFRLRDNRGREWRFRVDPAAVTDPHHPMNVAHLRHHLALGAPVTVYYRDAVGGPVAYRLVD
jgi:hypothetical protein